DLETDRHEAIPFTAGSTLAARGKTVQEQRLTAGRRIKDLALSRHLGFSPPDREFEGLEERRHARHLSVHRGEGLCWFTDEKGSVGSPRNEPLGSRPTRTRSVHRDE